MGLSSLNRRNTFQKFKEESYDLLIIGGGITGAGIALDASLRGMKVALVEMQDFSAGTSSRSTKLVHGGLRYLKNLQVKLVATVGKERAIVYENGPHVTTPEKMLLPMYAGGTFGKFTTSIALSMYDYLAQVKKGERRKMLKAKEALKLAPLLKKEGMKGGGLYVEYRTDDARLTIEVMKRAAFYGAEVINYVKMVSFNYDDEKKIEGAIVEDLMTQNRYLINAKQVINATGPWVTDIRDNIEHSTGKKLLLTKGIHIVIDQSYFPLKQAIYFDTKNDKRMIFVIPRGDKVYVGTTDTHYDDDKVNPVVCAGDRTYLLNAVNDMFPEIKLNEEHVESSWAGIRPLIWEEGKSPSEVSRKDEIWVDECGLMSIAGGKLTGYRHMAEEIVDKVAERLTEKYQREFKPCATHDEHISGGDVGGSANFEQFVEQKAKEASQYNLTEEEGRELARFYGSNIDQLFEIARNAQPDRMCGLPITVYTRLMYAFQHEAVVTPCDFFIRRTGALFFNIASVNELKIRVIQLMARYFGWDKEQIRGYSAELEKALYQATHAVEEAGIIKLEQK